MTLKPNISKNIIFAHLLDRHISQETSNILLLVDRSLKARFLTLFDTVFQFMNIAEAQNWSSE